MWKPSVNAIWLRAARRGCEAARRSGSITRRDGSVHAVVLPVDAGGVRAVEHLRAARAREVVPAPGDERVDAVAHAGHQRRVDAEPGGEGDRAVQLVAVRAHLGDRGAAPDHRHDALVVVVEGLARLAGEVGEHVVGRPRAALQRHGAELRQAARRPGRGCWRRRRSRTRPARRRRVRSGCTSTRPPRPCASPSRRQLGALMPPPQTTQRVGIVVPSDERRRAPGPTSVTATPRCSRTPLRCSTFAT